MRWLLDVNSLIALAHQGCADHSRVIPFDLIPDSLGVDTSIPGAYLIP